jgi:hypothetical protein
MSPPHPEQAGRSWPGATSARCDHHGDHAGTDVGPPTTPPTGHSTTCARGSRSRSRAARADARSGRGQVLHRDVDLVAPRPPRPPAPPAGRGHAPPSAPARAGLTWPSTTCRSGLTLRACPTAALAVLIRPTTPQVLEGCRRRRTPTMPAHDPRWTRCDGVGVSTAVLPPRRRRSPRSRVPMAMVPAVDHANGGCRTPSRPWTADSNVADIAADRVATTISSAPPSDRPLVGPAGSASATGREVVTGCQSLSASATPAGPGRPRSRRTTARRR